ncbi:hypothetical protein [Phormidesmis sp. 146-33]
MGILAILITLANVTQVMGSLFCESAEFGGRDRHFYKGSPICNFYNDGFELW